MHCAAVAGATQTARAGAGAFAAAAAAGSGAAAAPIKILMLVNLLCTYSVVALVDAHVVHVVLLAREQVEHVRLRERLARRGTRPPARGARSGRRCERGRGRNAAPGMRRPFFRGVKKFGG